MLRQWPDNLVGGVEGVRSRLRALGLSPEPAIFRASAFSGEFERRVRGLWDRKALNAAYLRLRRTLESWLERAHALEPDVAARESLLLGGQAIRQIIYDPLLPPPFVDVEARRDFVVAMQAMDREGRRIWRRFFEFNQVGQQPASFAH